MKSILKTLLATLVLLGISTTTLNADVKTGQKLYIKKLMKSCGTNGAIMAAKHTKAEWIKFHTDGKLAAEIKNICSTAPDKAVKEKYLQDYLDFFLHFAKDSEEVPEC